MKYAWLVVIAILLSAGVADAVDAMTYKDLAGRWCGDVTDYVFTPNTPTVPPLAPGGVLPDWSDQLSVSDPLCFNCL